MLGVVGIAFSVVSTVPYCLEGGVYLALLSPSIQLIAGFCYLQMIKGMCKQKWQLMTQGITFK